MEKPKHDEWVFVEDDKGKVIEILCNGNPIQVHSYTIDADPGWSVAEITIKATRFRHSK